LNRKSGSRETALGRNTAPTLTIRRLAIGLMTAVISLTACAGKIRYPSYYVLNLPAPVSRANPPASILGSVAVREFSAPRFLREGPIAYRESPEQLDFYDYHRWAEDPRRMVTLAMVRQMQAQGLFRSVDLFDGRGSPDCLMTGAIDHLEEVDQGPQVSIEVALSARLINLRTGEVLWQGASSKNSKLEQRSVPGIVSEMSREVSDMVEGLVSSMQNRVSLVSSSLNSANTEH
jgi:ABC-type uncharacterized transport system auxiliary subunit